MLIGALTGYLPLIWVALGLVLNGSVIALTQSILTLLFPTWNQLVQTDVSPACMVGFQRIQSLRNPAAAGPRAVAPSHWLGAATFFAVFSIYNSIRVALRESAPGTDSEKVDNRRAFSLSAFVIGIFFLCMVLARVYTGCETILGGGLGILMGAGIGIGFWHLLDLCGTGRVPDILQVVGSMAPEAAKGSEVPVMCVAPPEEEEAQ